MKRGSIYWGVLAIILSICLVSMPDTFLSASEPSVQKTEESNEELFTNEYVLEEFETVQTDRALSSKTQNAKQRPCRACELKNIVRQNGNHKITGVQLKVTVKKESQSQKFEITQVTEQLTETESTQSTEQVTETQTTEQVTETQTTETQTTEQVTEQTTGTQTTETETTQTKNQVTEAATIQPSTEVSQPVIPVRQYTIVLDPGHDNVHVGANGGGLHEEVINLQIAYACKAKLETYPGVHVYLTRYGAGCPYAGSKSTSDNDSRVAYAASLGADYFISIHINSNPSSSPNGATVYYQNANYRPDLSEKSHYLAEYILRNLVSLGLKNNGAMYKSSTDNERNPDGSLADYYRMNRIPKWHGLPAIIVEHAYISNASDRATYLSSDAAITQLGEADALGIAQFLGVTDEPAPVFTVAAPVQDYSVGAEQEIMTKETESAPEEVVVTETPDLGIAYLTLNPKNLKGSLDGKSKVAMQLINLGLGESDMSEAALYRNDNDEYIYEFYWKSDMTTIEITNADTTSDVRCRTYVKGQGWSEWKLLSQVDLTNTEGLECFQLILK